MRAILSEESNFEENCLRLLLFVVVMEMIVYTCVPNFTSMCPKRASLR